MYAFQLWREYKLSFAEIYAKFPNIKIEYVDKNICILDTRNREQLIGWVQHMWWVIKLIELIENYRWKPYENIYESIKGFTGKYRYWISILWEWKNLKDLLMKSKRYFKEKEISARFINKNFSQLSSAQIIWENLVERQSDFTLIVTWNKAEYFWKTIWIQDIDAYSKRDYGKTRDMEVGMLPPKLAQMMINIGLSYPSSHNTSLNSLLQGEMKQQNIAASFPSQGKEFKIEVSRVKYNIACDSINWVITSQIVYDPFCGLGTVLIESILMGNMEVYGSDISSENIEKTKLNIEYATNNFKNNLTKSELKVLDARGISSSPYLKQSDAIVTEWYLGQIFQKYSITEKKISEEKSKLLDIYSHFFEWLKRAKYQGNIVICFPFWEIKWKYFYFSEIYDIVNKHCNIQSLLPKNIDMKVTKSWSLLYKRDNQIVGREIFKLKMR